MSKTWVVVAESSRGRIYQAETSTSQLTEVEDLIHPASRMHEGELMTDRSGGDMGSSAHWRHAMEPKSSAHKEEIQHFAEEIAARLASAHQQGSFDRIILVAPPKCLGALRQAMSDDVANCITEELGKNLVQHSAEDVRAHLKSLLS